MNNDLPALCAALGIVTVLIFAMIGLFHVAVDEPKMCSVTYSNGKEVHVLVGEWK